LPFNGGKPSKRIRIRPLEAIGLFFPISASMSSAAYKDIWVEFARQFNIAQTFGHNRSSVKADGSNQIGPVEIKVRDP